MLKIILYWVVYFSLHSVLADDSVKSYLKDKLSLSSKSYRLIYSAISIIGISAISLFIFRQQPKKYLFEINEFSILLGSILVAIGLRVARIAFKPFSLSAFIGLEEEKTNLEIGGLYKKVRHPLYLATIIIIFGMLVIIPNRLVIISALCTFVYLPIGIYLEERKLIKIYGDDYIEYRKTTPAIFSYSLFFR